MKIVKALEDGIKNKQACEYIESTLRRDLDVETRSYGQYYIIHNEPFVVFTHCGRLYFFLWVALTRTIQLPSMRYSTNICLGLLLLV
jgi:hypothetical protein